MSVGLIILIVVISLAVGAALGILFSKSADDAVIGLKCPLCDAFFDKGDPPHRYVSTTGRGIIVLCGSCHRTFDVVIPKWQDSKEIDL